MINNGISDVPEKTIAVFENTQKVSLDNERLKSLISVPNKKRDWFDPHFYRCLPLSIANQYGFVLKNEYDFAVSWDGGESTESVKIFLKDPASNCENLYPRVESHFGHGIVTLIYPFSLRTPPGVNLMTINPPNTVLPNITVMSGVVETDNLRRDFTFNLKLQIPNIKTVFVKGTYLAGVIPLPRYYSDKFSLDLATNVFENDIVSEEVQADMDFYDYRVNIEETLPNGVGRLYLKGEDVYGNKFKDHQGP